MPAASKRREAYLTREGSYPLPVGDKLQSICTPAGGVSYPEKRGGKQEMLQVGRSSRVASIWVLQPLSWQMKMFGMKPLCVHVYCSAFLLITARLSTHHSCATTACPLLTTAVCTCMHKSLPFTLITARLSTYHSLAFLLLAVLTCMPHLLITALLLTTAVNTCRRKSLPFTHYSLPFYLPQL